MGRLLFLFVVVPALELALLIELGSRIGTLATLGLIAATGVIGASLARRQGLDVFQRLQQETNAGRLPADPLIDGAFLLVAGALLVTPGVLTDVVGFACLIPGFRRVVRRELRRRFERAVEEGRVEVHVATHDPWGPRVEKVVRPPEPPPHAPRTPAPGRIPRPPSPPPLRSDAPAARGTWPRELGRLARFAPGASSPRSTASSRRGTDDASPRGCSAAVRAGDALHSDAGFGGAHMAVTGGEWVARMLRAEGVEVVFGIVDGSYFGLTEGLRRQGIRLVSPRHETSAAHMAGAYARLTGRLGVCLASNGPGAANVLPGVAVENG